MNTHRTFLSIPADYARPLLEELARLGGDLESLWRQAAIETPLSSVLNGSVAALPATEFTRIYRYGAGELERLCCAREGRRPMGKRAVNMLCYCVVSCGTLGEAIARAAEFNAVMEERGGELRVREQGEVAQFTLQVPGRNRDSAALLVALTGLYFYYQLFSWLIGSRLQLSGAGIAYGAPDRPHPLLDVFGVPLKFDQPANSLSFPARQLAQRVVRSNAELESIVDFFPFDLSLGGARKTAFSDQIRLLFLDALQHRNQVPTLATVAQLFHVSPATLRRRLDEESTSYIELRAGCRYEMAECLLRQTEMPTEDIAERLGFSGDRAFRRAFREWAGETPTAYRRKAGV
ncbi:hypothetical protein B9N43_15055 [Denitratisoma sp. DHT3]|uniref:AraC family transcriptional regulator n=1 Tax=Denitratisoma sp. DHT3 TaxID=1981880 RepID=UPI0011986011|nr:AraC family transcriptional regulator [Denitratisoma sp. DHT3]QDX82437.1 hypothetical protein B9N43_15055 [Denitratisoma sp. DHT3]